MLYVARREKKPYLLGLRQVRLQSVCYIFVAKETSENTESLH